MSNNLQNSFDLHVLKTKLSIFGYDTEYEYISTDGLKKIYQILEQLPDIGYLDLPSITLDEVKTGARKFYDKYFTLHNVALASSKIISDNCEKISLFETGSEKVQKFNSFCSFGSPFDIPVHLVDGHSFIGETSKPMLMIDLEEFKKNVYIPFSSITLGDNLTELSIATYIHEIAHVLTESNKGYAKDYINKEVISIFLEKLAALDIDPTRKLLRRSEKMRYKYLQEYIFFLKKMDLAVKLGYVNETDILEAFVILNSTLLATKLFDNYEKMDLEGKQSLIFKIQQIFDGNLTVEELLESENVNIENSKNANLVRRRTR